MAKVRIGPKLGNAPRAKYGVWDGNPGTPVTLTVTGDLITDATRTTATLGDGKAPESSIGFWPASTNLVTNGGLETNTTGWNAVNATPTRVTTGAKFGSGCMQVVTNNVGADGAYHNFTATVAVYTISAWVKGNAGGEQVRIAVRDNSGANPQTGTAATLTTSWQRIQLITTNLTAATWRAYVETNAAQSVTFFFDGVQAEQKTNATPYLETDGSTTARTAGFIEIPVGTLVDETQSWFAVRCSFPQANTVELTGFPDVFKWDDDGTHMINGFFDFSGANNNIDLQRGGGTIATRSATVSFAANDNKTFVFAWNSSNNRISVDGAAIGQTGNTNIPTLSDTSFRVGANFCGNMYWVAMGTGPVVDADVAALHAFGNSDPQFEMFPSAMACKFIWLCSSTNDARSF